MPASSAAWIVAMLSARSAMPYVPDMPMHPSPRDETTGPVAPSCRLSRMRCTLSIDRLQAEGVALARAKPPAMTEHVASRTLVKSPPELWAECSDASSLARHLDQFGEIRITRLEPETAVAWEGERARGTVRIEPSGWGTKVILTAVAVAAEPLEAYEPPAALELPYEPEPPNEPETPEQFESQSELPVQHESHSEPSEQCEAEPERLAVAEPVEAVEPPTAPPARRRPFARLFGFFRAPMPEPVATEELEPEAQPEPGPTPESALRAESDPGPELDLQAEYEPALEPEPFATELSVPATPATEPPATEAALTAALDSLGQAHHRPYSRA